MSQTVRNNFMRELPKLELHCHLDGSLTQKSIEEIMERPVALSELQVEPDCRTLPFPPGARLLLCTDGLSNTLTEGQMHDLCRSSRDEKQICSRLIAAALARGARDNVTALVLFR